MTRPVWSMFRPVQGAGQKVGLEVIEVLFMCMM
jgi:hypothetical protein